ncbi:MAG TPA: aquaporin [Steroidobacteraceae bacterium]|nr:aquaporin [Steroidobacteraceae bacterium]
MPSSPPDRPLHGAPAPRNRLHPGLYLAEAAGTALLVLSGLSVVIAFFGSGTPLAAWWPDAALRRAMAGACFGTCGALITISPLGKISGAHLNPTMSFAFWLEGRLAWRDALGYVIAQCLGAIAGAVPLLLWGSFGASVNYGATLPGAGVAPSLAFAGEVFAGFALALTVLMMVAHRRTRRFTPWTMPLLFAWLVWWEAPLSGASANPARSLGPALISAHWSGFWIYALGPPLGAVLAIALLRLEVIGRHHVPVARLFHFGPDTVPFA